MVQTIQRTTEFHSCSTLLVVDVPVGRLYRFFVAGLRLLSLSVVLVLGCLWDTPIWARIAFSLSWLVLVFIAVLSYGDVGKGWALALLPFVFKWSMPLLCRSCGFTICSSPFTAHGLVRPWIQILRQFSEIFTFFYLKRWITDPEVDSRLALCSFPVFRPVMLDIMASMDLKDSFMRDFTWRFHRCTSWKRLSCPLCATTHALLTVELPQVQLIIKVIYITFAAQSLVPMVLSVQQTMRFHDCSSSTRISHARC